MVTGRRRTAGSGAGDGEADVDREVAGGVGAEVGAAAGLVPSGSGVSDELHAVSDSASASVAAVDVALSPITGFWHADPSAWVDAAGAGDATLGA